MAVKHSERFYLWRKAIGRERLPEWEAKMRERVGEAFAIIERPGFARAQIEVCLDSKREAEALVAEFGGRVRLLPRDWLQRFDREQGNAPLKIGARLIVRRKAFAGKRGRGGGRELIIPAAAAFGTGEHATTAMCLRMLERLTRRRKDWSLLDAGTGTGILALAAHRFGARRIVAIDADPIAISTAQQNARTNRIAGIQFRVADLGQFKPREQFDFITANLFSELLIASLTVFARRMRPGAQLILSGVLREQEAELLRALRRGKYSVPEVRRRGKWIAVRAGLVSEKAI